MLEDIPKGAKCIKCKVANATMWWTSEGVFAAVHGFCEARCETCCVEEQLEYAREMSARIPVLEQRLFELKNDIMSQGRVLAYFEDE